MKKLRKLWFGASDLCFHFVISAVVGGPFCPGLIGFLKLASERLPICRKHTKYPNLDLG